MSGGESKVVPRDVEFVFENLKLKLKIDKTVHEIKGMYRCGITDSYEYNFIIPDGSSKEKEEMISITDQFYAGGESTKVLVVQIEQETFIMELIQRFSDLWQALFNSLESYPIKDHSTRKHKEEVYEDGINITKYVDVPDKFMFVLGNKVSHVKYGVERR